MFFRALVTSNTTSGVTEKPTLTLYPTSRVQFLHWLYLAGYSLLFLLCASLIIYLRCKRCAAFRGDGDAARKILLPSLEPLLWILAGTTGAYTLFFATIFAIKVEFNTLPAVMSEVYYAGRQFVLLLVLVFMLQKSITVRALQRTVVISFVCASYTTVVYLFMSWYGDPSDRAWVRTLSRGCLVPFYLYVFIWPPQRASQRAIREYCAFTFVYYALLFASTEIYNRDQLTQSFAILLVMLLWVGGCPLVVWKVLRADTEYWRGMSCRACFLQSLFRQRRDIIDEHVSSQGLHVLIEMHQSFLIDFAYLDIKRRIGVGGSAIVFNGLLRSKTPVAVKVYVPKRFDEDAIAAFSHEAALCGSLNHPNIVKFYGLCISPPTICIVSELCLGTLEDIMCANALDEQNPRRENLLVKLAYMLDAARAVAYLHSFSPKFLHRDIKPGNFLLDMEGNVKLTDFGESRALPRDHVPANTEVNPAAVAPNSPSASGVSVSSTTSTMSVCGTVNYMAPEVINGRAGRAEYGDAVDIYSLAITMWDILYPGAEKFPTVANNHMKIFELVVDGKRPSFHGNTLPALRELIENAWQADARLRPSAQEVVSSLEGIQEDLHLRFALELHSAMLTPEMMHIPAAPIERCFTGAQAQALLLRAGYAATTGESLRLGNALMDAGLLHHVNHSRGFENSEAIYYFDDESIQLSEPIHPLDLAIGAVNSGYVQRARGEDGDGSATASRSRRSRSIVGSFDSGYGSYFSSSQSNRSLLGAPGDCDCRRLGQRLSPTRKSSRKLFRRRNATSSILPAASSQSLTTRLLDDDEIHDAIWNEFDSSEFIDVVTR